ncbi:MAG: hypothetical protein J4F97_07235, partial [Pseudomonadales bacterium]|nr:hypothetical protein [Pseudomonadales bacterium]
HPGKLGVKPGDFRTRLALPACDASLCGVWEGEPCPQILNRTRRDVEWECHGAGMMKGPELALPDSRREGTLLYLQGTIDAQE